MGQYGNEMEASDQQTKEEICSFVAFRQSLRLGKAKQNHEDRKDTSDYSVYCNDSSYFL